MPTTPRDEHDQASGNLCRVKWQGRFRCKSPFCDLCRRRYVRQEQRLNRQRFGDCPDCEIVAVNIEVGYCWAIESIDRLIKKALRDMRNRIHACRRADPTWNDVTIAGWWQIAASHDPQSNEPIWSVRAHLVVATGAVARDGFLEAMRRQWRVPEAVQAFQHVRSSGAQLVDRVIEQAHRPSFRLDGWPVEWKTTLSSWLRAHRRNAFEYFRFNIEPAHEPRGRLAKYGRADDDEWGAMPVLI